MKLVDGGGHKGGIWFSQAEMKASDGMKRSNRILADELRSEASSIRDGQPCDDATLLDVAATVLEVSPLSPLEIKAARIALGMNQREFAEALRVGSEAIIRSWESGRRPISGPATVAIKLMLQKGR